LESNRHTQKQDCF